MIPLMALVSPGFSAETSASPTAEWRELYDAYTVGAPVPAFDLIDQDGQTFSLARYADAYVVVAFVFTRCPMPEACPLTMGRLAALDAEWDVVPHGDRKLEILVVTLDPVYDTPERLRALRTRHGPFTDRLTLATGEPELVAQVLPSMFSVVALPSGPADIAHSVRLTLLGPGRIPLASWQNNQFSSSEVVARVLAP